jgi:carbamoyl-phosphate synthase large subunit
MPKRTDLNAILIIGSGPIVIGQGCEFDYSGTQACRALREEGYRVVLINSNPATIMTDPEMADATYVEPITPAAIDKILTREQQQGTPIDAVLPTLGGQTGLNVGMACHDEGIFQKHNVEMIGANREAIFKGEDRQAFKDLMVEIGLKVPASRVVGDMAAARAWKDEVGLPLIIRPAFTLGGTGGGIAYTEAQFEDITAGGLDASPVTEVLIEQSVLGWKEFELEVVRDKADNAVVICGIENIDPMGVHTGDSITVAPIQTLTDKEYQRMRDAALAVIRAVGVETGGSNIQFAVNPADGEMVVVEMNPRVSRSSALASKATGYPIAKIAAKLAVGYTLDELPNDITKKTPACFEPTIDYVVVKMPRWTFEKFPEADETLTTQMKSVGEAMAIGRTFKQALQKAIRSMEVGRFGLGLDSHDKSLQVSKPPATRPDREEGRPAQPASGPVAEQAAAPPTLPDGRALSSASEETQPWPISDAKLRRKLTVPSQGRLYYVRYALKMGWTVEQVYEATKIDPWFLREIKGLVRFEAELEEGEANAQWVAQREAYADEQGFFSLMQDAKQLGYSDVQISESFRGQFTLFAVRVGASERPLYKLVDTCAAEFEAQTPYYYSSYESAFQQLTTDHGQRTKDQEQITDDEIRITDRPKVVIIGGGPNRIGQGIEFDYCCCQAAFAARELGLESVMVNSNPETVSTDYDTSDLLFFEPLTHEDVLNVVERLNGGPFPSDVHARHDREGVRPAQPASSPVAEQAAAPPTLPDGRALSSASLVRGVIVQFGGQTPLNLAKGLEEAGVPILGTSVAAIHRAGDREQFRELLAELGLKQPANGIARSVDEAKTIAADVGYPVLVRPSFVLGGRAMEIVYDEAALDRYMQTALAAAGLTGIADSPILVDKFLDRATEVDVDCVADYGAEGTKGQRNKGTKGSESEPSVPLSLSPSVPQGRAVIAGVMEHIEEAGIHSGDSACVLPPHSLPVGIVNELKRQTRLLAEALQVNGLMNVQYAVKDGEVFVIEVNPRASRTVPFVGKTTGTNWARIAAKVMMGATLDELGVQDQPDPPHVAVKEAVFPFSKFPGCDIILGPEMKSTGEVMGLDETFPMAFAKSQLASGVTMPTGGTLFVSVNDADKPGVVPIARRFADLGFNLISTGGTHDALTAAGIESTKIHKIADEQSPNLKDYIDRDDLALILNTPTRKGSGTDEAKIRALAFRNHVPIVTTLTAGEAWAKAIAALREGDWQVKPLQAW